MPKIEQHNLQVFFVPKDNSIEDLERFIAKNSAMLKLYLIVVEDLNERLKVVLDKYEIDYIKPKNQHFGKNKISTKNTRFLMETSENKSANFGSNPSVNQTNRGANLGANQNANPSNQSAIPRDSIESKAKSIESKIFTDLIRSGREISANSDIIIFNRVNSGANIKSTKSIFVFGKCDGNIDCKGDFMVLSQIAKGKILFQGIAITSNMLKYKLNLITKDKIGPKITDILALLN